MPDPNVMLRAMAVSAALALVVVVVPALMWRLTLRKSGRAFDPTRVGMIEALGVGLGFFAGCWLLMESPPHWPPLEDQDRFLLVLLPIIVLAELLAGIPKLPWWVSWLLRLLVAAAAARILLHGSSYLAAPSDTDTSQWTPDQQWLILGSMAALLAGVWVLLALLLRKAPGRSVPLALALTCGGAAVTIMYSGYLTGGQLGLPLAAALIGTAAASFALSGSATGRGSLGVGLVGLFGLLVIGRFFGSLTTTHALLLFLGLLLCWVPEAPYVVKLRPWLRGSLRVALAAVPVVLVVVMARQQFVKDSEASGAKPGEPTLQDYLESKGP